MALEQKLGDIINFNKIRKERELAAKKQKSSENRVLFGQTRAEKQSSGSALDKIRKALDGSKLDGPDDPPKPPLKSV